MALDKLMIGTRIRKIREEIFHESRKDFAERCGLTETHVGQIERGQILLSLITLDRIVSRTGVSVDDILYGPKDSKNFNIRKYINNYLNLCDINELKIYYNFISSMKSYYIDNGSKASDDN